MQLTAMQVIPSFRVSRSVNGKPVVRKVFRHPLHELTELAIPRNRNALAMVNSARYAAPCSFVEMFGRVAERPISKNMTCSDFRNYPGYKFNFLVDQDMVFPSAYRG